MCTATNSFLLQGLTMIEGLHLLGSTYDPEEVSASFHMLVSIGSCVPVLEIDSSLLSSPQTRGHGSQLC